MDDYFDKLREVLEEVSEIRKMLLGMESGMDSNYFTTVKGRINKKEIMKYIQGHTCDI